MGDSPLGSTISLLTESMQQGKQLFAGLKPLLHAKKGEGVDWGTFWWTQLWFSLIADIRLSLHGPSLRWQGRFMVRGGKGLAQNQTNLGSPFALGVWMGLKQIHRHWASAAKAKTGNLQFPKVYACGNYSALPQSFVEEEYNTKLKILDTGLQQSLFTMSGSYFLAPVP